MLLSGELLAERAESLSNNTFQSYYASRKETQGFELGNIYFFMTGQNTKGNHPPAVQTSPGLQGAWLAAPRDGDGSDWDSISGLIPGEVKNTALGFGGWVLPPSQLLCLLGGT